MAIDEKYQVIFNGKESEISVVKAQIDVLDSDISFSGSLEYGENNALLFNLVKKEDMKYIFKELEKIKNGVKLDIRTNDETATGI